MYKDRQLASLMFQEKRVVPVHLTLSAHSPYGILAEHLLFELSLMTLIGHTRIDSEAISLRDL
jgi:hypothetical protein